MLLDNNSFESSNDDLPNNYMIGCLTKNTLVDKSFQDQTTPLLTPPLLLPDNLLNHDHYLFHHDYLKLLLFAFVHCQLSLKHNDGNGDGNSSKKNSQKNHLKELVKTPSLSSGLALKIELMIQLPSRGVMLRFSLFIYLIHISLVYAVLPLLTSFTLRCFLLHTRLIRSFIFHP